MASRKVAKINRRGPFKRLDKPVEGSFKELCKEKCQSRCVVYNANMSTLVLKIDVSIPTVSGMSE